MFIALNIQALEKRNTIVEINTDQKHKLQLQVQAYGNPHMFILHTCRFHYQN